MTTYFEHNAGQPELDVVDGDPSLEPPIERVVLCEHGNARPCPDCLWFAAWDAIDACRWPS